MYPDQIGNLDGIPALVRDAANRDNLQLLIGKLEGAGRREVGDAVGGAAGDRPAVGGGAQPPMFLLGIGDEGNGRAIVSYGNPDTARNVSAYVPGLGTSLDEDFAKNDLKRARDTAIGAAAMNPDSSTASIVWLGYDAPSDRHHDAGNFDVMGKGAARLARRRTAVHGGNIGYERARRPAHDGSRPFVRFAHGGLPRRSAVVFREQTTSSW